MAMDGTIHFQTGIDYLADAVAASRSSALALARGHGDLGDVTAQLMQETAEELAEGFTRVVRARTPGDSAAAYMEFLLAASQRTMRQMSRINAMLARTHAETMAPFAPNSAASTTRSLAMVGR